jgi:hypothetical protein
MGCCFEIPGVCSTKRTRLYLGGVLSGCLIWFIYFPKTGFTSIYPLYAIYCNLHSILLAHFFLIAISTFDCRITTINLNPSSHP